MQQQQYNNNQMQQQQYNNQMHQQPSSHDQVRRQQQMMPQQPQPPNYNINQGQQNTIPAYTIGMPLCGQKRQDRCYLEFKTAYPNRNN